MSTTDPAVRSGVVEYVDGCLADMPEVLRLGVLAESVLLTLVALTKGRGRLSPSSVGAALDLFAAAPIGLLRQYPRLLHSLVLFAELELDRTSGDASQASQAIEATQAGEAVA